MISIVTIAYNQRHYTEMLLKSITDPRCADRPFDLVFVDNGSTDGTPEMVKQYPLKKNPNFMNLTYFAFEENKGVAAAINKGVELSRRPVILQADNDIVFGFGSLGIMCDWINNYPEAMISPNWPWIQKKLGLHYFAGPNSMTESKHKKLRRLGIKAPAEKYRATGSCWMCSKALFEKVGGWDRAFRNICASDDFLFKIALSGAKRYTIPCPIYHPGKITRTTIPKNNEQQEKDLNLFISRWGGHPEDKSLVRKLQLNAGITPDPVEKKSIWKKLLRK